MSVPVPVNLPWVLDLMMLVSADIAVPVPVNLPWVLDSERYRYSDGNVSVSGDLRYRHS